MWVNHDHDLVDVGLHGTTTASPTSGTTPTAAPSTGAASPATPTASTPIHRWLPPPLARLVTGIVATVAIAVTLVTAAPAHAVTATATTTTPSSPTPTETIHTTATHPWLTAVRGWVAAGALRPGEHVVTLSGTTGLATATVAWVHVVAGQADMYNLTVVQDHTYAVGDGQYIVHNTGGPCFGGNSGNTSAAQVGNDFHYDRFNGGESDNYGGPSQLQDIYPNTEFRFTPNGAPGPDVEVVGGQHPSTYGRGDWPAGANIADFKPATKGGRDALRVAIRNNPVLYPPDTVPIWYSQALYQIVGIGWG